jgi:hypothetical protein
VTSSNDDAGRTTSIYASHHAPTREPGQRQRQLTETASITREAGKYVTTGGFCS